MCVQLFSCQFFFFKSLGCQISIINLVRLFLRSLDSVTFSQHEALTDLTWHWSNLSKKASLGRSHSSHILYQNTNTQIHKYANTQIHKHWSNLSKKASLGRRYLPHIWYQDTNSQIRKYTNTQIHKYTNTQIHKYTNSQIHKYKWK